MQIPDIIQDQIAYYRARASEYDQWFFRQGRFDHGAEFNKKWFADVATVANALDAMAEANTPGPSLDVTVGENLAGSEVWVRVRDNGPGMEPERLSNIFSPFYTTKEAGTGLGLALSKKVVDAHGGTLEANSAPGEGSEFVLTLPKHAENGGAPR